jgi:FHS family L-fucose permease-like MFS transporter
VPWPLAIDGLGKFTKQGSALLIMGIVGGALTPLLYDESSRQVQSTTWVLVIDTLLCIHFIL